MSIPRRGYFAVGLAVAVVGSLGVSALNAGADEVAGTPAPVAEASVDPDAPPTFAQTGEEASSPPPVLPWGQEPAAVTKGPVNATSEQLAAIGADIAPKRGPRVLRPEYSPKGYVSTKRTLRSGRTSVAPEPPAATLAEPVPAAARPVKYHYASAFQYTEADGTYANLVIGKPTLAAEDYHTLAEIAVQSADAKQIVEVGWTVDRGVNGDEEPHLFVYHWVDGKETCYNACGFKQYSKTVFPGDKLAEGTAKRMGIQYFNGAWWIAFDSEWVGYFPGELWDGGFTRSGLIQWFGEVAASSSEPCSGMGTGVIATDDARAARFGTISLLNSKDLPVISVSATSPNRTEAVYPAVRSSDRTYRYGGPGSPEC